MIVDDNPADVVILQQALRECGHSYIFDVFHDSERALEFIRSYVRDGETDPCLIVLDLNLPGCDGTAVLSEIRTSQLRNTDVVVLTSLATPSQRKELRALGVDHYHTKPMDWNEVLDLARELLEFCVRPRHHTAAH